MESKQKPSFGLGIVFVALSLWFFFDSVRVTTGATGAFTQFSHHYLQHTSVGTTTSVGLIFIPFIAGVIAMVYYEGRMWPMYLTWAGIAIIAIEMLSHLQFRMLMKSSHLLLLMGFFALGVGLILQSKKRT